MVTSLNELPAMVIFLGSDSLMAGLVIGPFVTSWRAGAAYALLFGACDGAATMLGSIIPHRVVEPPALLIYLVAAVVFAHGVRCSRGWLYALPALFSLDNLAAGYPAVDAPGLALGSAAMAGFGLALGAFGRILATQLALAEA